MGHFNEHGGVSPTDEEQNRDRLAQVNMERERQGLLPLSYLCVANGMPPTTYQGGED